MRGNGGHLQNVNNKIIFKASIESQKYKIKGRVLTLFEIHSNK